MADAETEARRRAYQQRMSGQTQVDTGRASAPAPAPAGPRVTVRGSSLPSRGPEPRPVPPPRNRGGLRLAGVWAAVLLLVAGVAFVVVHLRGPETPDGNDPAEATATAVSAMLDESVAGRANLLRAIDEIMSCRTGKTTRQGIQNAVKARQALLKKVGDFDASSLPTGAKIKTGLQEALTRSLEADQAYLKWYDAAKGRCPKQSGTLFKAVQKANARSRAAKNAFLEDWNPVAQQYNLPERDAGSI